MRYPGNVLRRYLALTLALTGLAGALLFNGTARAAGDCSVDPNWGSDRPDYAERVVELVNQHRASMGLGTLRVTSTLTASAVWKAHHMAGYGYMTHEDPAPPVARTAAQRFKDCGYLTGTWGENIANGYTTPEAVMEGWLNSSGHRQNIENGNYTAIGVGAALSSSGRMYWAQSFGLDDGSGVVPSPPPPLGALSVVPNSSYVRGLNAVVIQGSGSAALAAAEVASDSGRGVSALWIYSSNRWLYFLPALPSVNGGLSTLPGPAAAAFAVLG